MLIDVDLFIIHVYQPHSAYLKALHNSRLLKEERDGVLLLSTLCEAILRGRFANCQVLKYNANVLHCKLIVLCAKFVPRIDS